MDNAKIASPLFIIREQCTKDLMGSLEKLAEIGYEGIEFLGFFGHSPADIRRKLDSLGLRAVGNHVPFGQFSQETAKVIEDHAALGCGYITMGAPDAKGMPDGEDYAASIAEINRMGTQVRQAGMKMLFHNHGQEPKLSSNGKTILDNLMDDTSPEALFLEPDLGWLKIGGGDPAHYLIKYADRTPVVHFKDFYSEDLAKTAAYTAYDGEKRVPESGYFEFRPTGYGIMNNAELYKLALACKSEWYVMDHDKAYERDAFEDLRLSLEYFKALMAIAN